MESLTLKMVEFMPELNNTNGNEAVEASGGRDDLYDELDSLANEWHLASMRAPETDRRRRTVDLLREAVTQLRIDQARIEAVKRMLPGERTFAETVSRDFTGKPFPRLIDADQVREALEK